MRRDIPRVLTIGDARAHGVVKLRRAVDAVDQLGAGWVLAVALLERALPFPQVYTHPCPRSPVSYGSTINVTRDTPLPLKGLRALTEFRASTEAAPIGRSFQLPRARRHAATRSPTQAASASRHGGGASEAEPIPVPPRQRSYTNCSASCGS